MISFYFVNLILNNFLQNKIDKSSFKKSLLIAKKRF